MTENKPDYTSDKGPTLKQLFAAAGNPTLEVDFVLYDKIAPRVSIPVKALIVKIRKSTEDGFDTVFALEAIFTFADNRTERVTGRYKPLAPQKGRFNRT